MSDHISAFPSAWVARYAHIPKFPARSIVPEYDGDMALLSELADKIIDLGLTQGFTDTDQPGQVMVPPSIDWHYRNVIGETDINPHQLLRYWPADLAGELLRQWKAKGR